MATSVLPVRIIMFPTCSKRPLAGRNARSARPSRIIAHAEPPQAARLTGIPRTPSPATSPGSPRAGRSGGRRASCLHPGSPRSALVTISQRWEEGSASMPSTCSRLRAASRGRGARPRRAGGSAARSARRGCGAAPRPWRPARPAPPSRPARAPARGGPATRSAASSVSIRPIWARSSRRRAAAPASGSSGGRGGSGSSPSGGRAGGPDRPRRARAGRRPASPARSSVVARRARRGRRRSRSALGDVGAAAVLGGDQPLALERQVGGASGVHVDPGEAGQLADARQPVAGAEGAADDHRPELPVELGADRDSASRSTAKSTSAARSSSSPVSGWSLSGAEALDDCAIGKTQ